MDLPVYMHNGCSAFTRSAHLMLHHLRAAHGPAVAAFLDTPRGLAMLDGQISEHLLATAPPGTLSHICLTCDVILGTRFQATTHLSLPQHAREYQLALNNTGQAGIKALLSRRWLSTTQAAQSNYELAPETAPATSLPSEPTGQLRYLQSFYTAGEEPGSRHVPTPTADATNRPVEDCKFLRLSVRDYTTRARFPAALDLRVVVPRATRTVAGLARCVEAAFVRDADGEAGAIDWARVIAVCGIVFETHGREVVGSDEQVVAWVAAEGGEAEERAEMKRRLW